MKVETSGIRKGSKNGSVFPTKKRVQVSPYTRAEMEQDRLKDKSAEIDRNGPKIGPVVHKHGNMPSTSEKGEQSFRPFFWLREEGDLDKSTQQTDDNLVMYTPPEVPCFSDIKGSDDEVSSPRCMFQFY